MKMGSRKNKLTAGGLTRLDAAQIIGAEVRRQREARGLTQQRLAGLARTTQASIAQLESGTRNPTIGLLERVARAMNMDLVMGLRKRLGE